MTLRESPAPLDQNMRKRPTFPLISRKLPVTQYQYGNIVRIAEGTDFLLFLKAVAAGDVYYDPGIKIENLSGPNPRPKKRSQFRVRSGAISALYRKVEEVAVESVLRG